MGSNPAGGAIHRQRNVGKSGARRGERIAELVYLHDVRNKLASCAEPDHPDGQHQSDGHHAGGGDLPVAFAEDQIGVTLVPLLPCEIYAAFHADASLLAIEHAL